jgi:tryptophan synthase beta chain
MGAEDILRQRPNVERMHLLGAEVIAVEEGSQTLKEAINEALRDWVTNVDHTHYILGSVLGPDPYPRMVRDFQRVIGDETRGQVKRVIGRRWPDVAVACVGGGSNALGLFTAYLEDARVRLIGVEAGGCGSNVGQHSARFSGGSVGVLHGTRTRVLQDAEGQIASTHSVSAGLDYPAVSPELAHLHDEGRVEFTTVSDEDALRAFHLLAATEGILPALESAHAVAEAMRHAVNLAPQDAILVNLSGRGDKDLQTVLRQIEDRPPEEESAAGRVHPAATWEKVRWGESS